MAMKWTFYQFLYREDEVVVARSSFDEQYAFRVTDFNGLVPVKYKLRVAPVVRKTSDRNIVTFPLCINDSSTIEMYMPDKGLVLGTKQHWAGKWSSFIYDDLCTFVGAYKALKPPAPYQWREPRTTQPNNETEQTEMNTHELITVMQLQGGARIVSATYIGASPAPLYHFKNVLAVDLAKGDVVTVETKGTFALVTVVDPNVAVDQVDINLGALKHVVSRVATDSYKRVLEAEANARHTLALSEVTERLNKVREQIGDNTFTSLKGILSISETPKE